jgi:hypothetical protein
MTFIQQDFTALPAIRLDQVITRRHPGYRFVNDPLAVRRPDGADIRPYQALADGTQAVGVVEDIQFERSEGVQAHIRERKRLSFAEGLRDGGFWRGQAHREYTVYQAYPQEAHTEQDTQDAYA